MIGQHARLLCVIAISLLLLLASSGTSSGRPRGFPTAVAQERVLTVAYPAGWHDLDPSASFASEVDVLSQIYETLTRYDATKGKILPNLATSWTHNRRGTIWTFRLRKGVKFQDGSTFNANAVKFSIERMKRLNKGAAFIWREVKAVDIVDPYTVRLRLSAPRPMDLISSAAWGGFMLSPQSDQQPSSWFNEGHGIGTGPYMWKSYTPSQSAVLTQFPGYWGGWRPNQFTQVLLSLNADATTRQQELITGNAQVAEYLGFEQLKNLAGRANMKVHSLNVAGIYYLAFNMTKPPLTDVRIRQALAYSFPHDQVVKTVYGQFAKPQKNALIPRGMWGYTKLPGYSLNLNKAKSLLRAAGKPNGGFTVEMVYIQNYPQDAQIGQLWKPVLAQLGITLRITQVSFDTWLKDCCGAPGSGVEIMTANWPPTYPSPYDYLYSNFGTGGPGGNGSHYKTKADDKLLAQGLTQSATNRKAAGRTFALVQRHIMAAAATIPIVDYPANVATSSRLTNVTVRGATLWFYGLRTT
jgi:peptide/nickel transport system substrate-binding protein